MEKSPIRVQIISVEGNTMCIKGRSILLCISLAYLSNACSPGDGDTSVSALASEATEQNAADAKAATEARAKEREKKEADKSAEKMKEKELAAAKAITRKEITNAQDKIQRAQANLSRNEQLIDSLKGRRDQTKQELSNLLNGGSGGGSSGSSRRSREQLMALIKQQEDEIVTMQNAIQKQKDDIAALEKLVDDMTKKL